MRVAALAVLLAALLSAPARPAWACSCVPPQGPAVALNDAAAVFSGTVTGITDRGSFNWMDRVRQFLGQPPQSAFMASRLVTLSVADSWKGVTETPVSVGTTGSSASCGYDFVLGGQYVVYAYADGGQLLTNICLRTVELSQAATDLSYLQTRPSLPITAAPVPVAVWAVAVSGLVLGALSLAVVGGLLWRRHRLAASV